MAGLGPFPSRPLLAAGVSGGADSTALALLAQDWAKQQGGDILALIIDHGLRPESVSEASLTRSRLQARGIAAQVIRLSGLGGAGLQETARRARHAALATAAREAGALFLLLGHHAGDQSETVAMRAERGRHGLEGMAAWAARNDAVILRPLLGIAPARLREFLLQENMSWVEDPSNDDPRFERVRVRLAGTRAVPEPPAARREREASVADFLARHSILRPEGFAVILANAAPPAALAALLRTIGGRHYAPRLDAVRELAARLRPATLGGVRIVAAGRLGPGWLLVREAEHLAPPIPDTKSAVWDGRFRLRDSDPDGICGAAGADASHFRNGSDLPAAVVATLACIRMPENSACKPRLAKVFFAPPAPAAAHPFLAAPAGLGFT